MKTTTKIALFIVPLLCSISLLSNAQVTLHLRANESDYLDNYSPSQNQSSAMEMDAIAWTAGNSFVSRSVFSFDLSKIPANSTINSAYLSLWGDTNTGNKEGDSPLSGSNAWYIQRVNAAWNVNTVNWNTQPTTDTTHEILMPQSVSIYQIYNGINVTKLMQDIEKSGNNYGLLIRLQTEVQFRSMVFCSSQYPDTAERPLLVINYTTSTAGIEDIANKPVVTLYPNPAANNLTINYSAQNSGEVYYSIYNLMGKQLVNNTLLGRGTNIMGTVNTGNLASGMYFVQLIDGGNVTNYKFIKE